METNFTSLYFKITRIKNTVLLFCCFAFTTQICQAQPYESIFGKDSTSFYIVKPDLKGLIPEYFTHINGMDTLINNTEYSVFSSDYHGSLFLREDSAKAIVYFYDETFNKERRAMDLNLTVGDSFYLGFDTISTREPYHTVDSVYTVNGRKHVRLDFEFFGKNEKLEFIEGVGPTAGLSFKKSVDYFGSYLICSWKDDSNIFGSKYYDGDCDPEITSVPDYNRPFENSITLYPNPTRNEIRIAGDQSEQFKDYRILSIDGRLVKSGRLNNEKVIQAGELSPGLYVVVLLHDEGSITRKIVIE